MELPSLSHSTLLMNVQGKNFKIPISLTRTRKIKPIIESYNTVFLDNSHTQYKTKGQAVPEISLFDSDQMQLD